MPLESGSQLGAYTIVGPLGAGAMGEVYRARDTKLGRDVALKILPSDFALDAERLGRFEREAQLLAALNHPRIAGIYGLDEHDGQPFLALEIVEGEDLSARLARGALPVDEAIGIALQIANALEGAHEKGIIHRDLKPANIKLTPDGDVKVLDFGLAKALDPSDDAPPELSQSPTMTRDSTRVGVVLGTAAYMSPEQARGKRVDERTDVFAFGAVVYEMLTGERAFAGDDVGEILASVIKTEPDWAALPSAVPHRVRRVLERCLAKDARLRYHAVADARLDLETEEERARPVAPVDSTRGRWGWAAAALFGLGWLLTLAWPGASPPVPVATLSVSPPPGTTLQAAPSVSPDGNWIAMLVSGTSGGSEGAVVLRTIDGQLEQRVPDSAEASAPLFWSPDSREVGFQQGEALVRARVEGGSSVRICELGVDGIRTFAAWSAAGDVVFGEFAPGLRRCSTRDGSSGTIEVRFGDERLRVVDLAFVGESRELLLRGARGADVRHYRAELTDDDTLDVEETTDGFIAASGYVLSRQNDVLVARRRGVEGELVPIAPLTRFDRWSVSRNGLLVYARGPRQNQGRLQLVDRRGGLLRSFGESGDYWAPRVTRDGAFFIAEVHGEESVGDLSTFDVTSGRRERVTFDPMHHNAFVAWSPDSRRAVFHSTRPPNGGLFEVAPFDGTEERKLRDAPSTIRPTDWSPDGRTVLMDTYSQSWDILAYDTESGELGPFLAGDGMEAHGHFAPDGRFVAYASDATGELEVYLRSYPQPGFLRQVSLAGGQAPRFRADGRELFYLAPGNTIMVVPLDLPASPPVIGTPTPLFKAPIRSGGRGTLRTAIHWDVLPDGQSFVIIANERDAWHDATMIVNWPELVRRTEAARN